MTAKKHPLGISPEHENEHALAALVGTYGMVHPSVMATARRHGWVTDVPGVFGAMLTRRNYLAALEEFGQTNPDALEAVASRRALNADRARQQRHMDATTERQKRAMQRNLHERKP